MPKINSRMSWREKQEYFSNFKYPYCDNSSKYEKLAKIGQGTYGEVFKAKDTETNKIVALKKVLMNKEAEGFPITAMREIKILKYLNNENIVKLIEVCNYSRVIANKHRLPLYMVLEFCEHDLAGLLANRAVKFNMGEIKKVMQQLYNGLYYIHCHKILHRDLKSANILITKTGILKLADFGLARPFSIKENGEPNRFTNRVVTLWYRPPELLLGERNYGPPIDLWGAGCIMAEMWTRMPILQGHTEQQQLDKIAHLCGSISPDVWPNVKNLELYNKIELVKGIRRKVQDRLRPFIKDAHACDLVDRLLTLDPSRRIDANDALDHDFFWTDPMPCDLSRMLSQHSQSMFNLSTGSRRDNRHPHHQMIKQQPKSPTLDSTFCERIY